MRAMAATRILFVCVGNTCRSPMAEAIARGLAGDAVEALSAGFAPTGAVSPLAEATVRRLGYSAEGLTSHGLDEVSWGDLDVVVSLIGDHGLLLIPAGAARTRLAWDIPDPYGEELQTFETVGRMLQRRIEDLLDELGVTHPDGG